nr:hypothetical protein CFP56_56124 [Quercus suber]
MSRETEKKVAKGLWRETRGTPFRGATKGYGYGLPRPLPARPPYGYPAMPPYGYPGYHHQQGMYARPPPPPPLPAAYYDHQYRPMMQQPRVAPPLPLYGSCYTRDAPVGNSVFHYFSDDNTKGCSIMVWLWSTKATIGKATIWVSSNATTCRPPYAYQGYHHQQGMYARPPPLPPPSAAYYDHYYRPMMQQPRVAPPLPPYGSCYTSDAPVGNSVFHYFSDDNTKGCSIM